MDKTIMGQNVNELLIIKDSSANGRITFFMTICILIFAFCLYNVAIAIWTSKKETLLMSYKSELYKKYKKNGTREKKILHAPSKVPVKKKKPILSNPESSDIKSAMENLHRFHSKKHL